MSNITTITCDGCGSDITSTGNSEGYRLALKVERLPCHGAAVTDMLIYPPIDKDHHFCDVTCLKKWINTKQP